jgi:Leucine-rich repeat (LRR) protein
LAGLSNLLELLIAGYGNELRNLDGISTGVVDVHVANAPKLVSMAGIEVCTSLEKLSLSNCGVASLQPLSGLSSMKELWVSGCYLTSLEDLQGTSLQSLTLRNCGSVIHLSGFEHLSALKSLHVMMCGVASLQPLSGLEQGLQKLEVYDCSDVQEEVLELPHVQLTADVGLMYTNVREVVLAGGVRRAVGPVRSIF